MKKRLFAALGIAALAFLATAQESKTDRSLKVTVKYTGAGKVDDKHKILLFLFDSPDFMQGSAAPIASQAATAKDQAVTFSVPSGSAVYVTAVFDPTGAYEGMSAPPSGSSLGMYSTEPGKPAPVSVETGKTLQIVLAFDDSAKMP
jgi:hypothetical protein